MVSGGKNSKHNVIIKMKTLWSKKWKSSKQPRKQRKYRFNSPLHVKRKFMSALLSKDLRKKYNTRNIPIRVKDKVKILRGQFKGLIGEVEKVSLKKSKIFVRKAEFKKEEGRVIKYPISPSNVQIIDIDLSDKKRKQAIEKSSQSKSYRAKGEDSASVGPFAGRTRKQAIEKSSTKTIKPVKTDSKGGKNNE